MDPEDSLFSEGSEKMSSIIQYISTLSLTMNLEDESQTFEFPQSPNNAKLLDISRSPYKSIPDCSESKVQDTEDFENEQKLKTIKVEVEFLKQSIDYLKNVLTQKSQKVQSKDEKICKLEKVIGKQKKKLKDLNSRIKFQGSKLAQLEIRVPAYFEKVEKIEKPEKKSVLGKISLKKSKISSSSPKIKNQVLQIKHFSPR